MSKECKGAISPNEEVQRSVGPRGINDFIETWQVTSPMGWFINLTQNQALSISPFPQLHHCPGLPPLPLPTPQAFSFTASHQGNEYANKWDEMYWSPRFKTSNITNPPWLASIPPLSRLPLYTSETVVFFPPKDILQSLRLKKGWRDHKIAGWYLQKWNSLLGIKKAFISLLFFAFFAFLGISRWNSESEYLL